MHAFFLISLITFFILLFVAITSSNLVWLFQHLIAHMFMYSFSGIGLNFSVTSINVFVYNQLFSLQFRLILSCYKFYCLKKGWNNDNDCNEVGENCNRCSNQNKFIGNNISLISNLMFAVV